METPTQKTISARFDEPWPARLLAYAARETLARGRQVTVSDVIREMVEKGLRDATEEREVVPA